MIGETEGTSILTDDLHVGPTQTSESSSGDLAKRGREVDEIDGAEEVRNRDKLGHLLNVPAGTAANLRGVSAWSAPQISA